MYPNMGKEDRRNLLDVYKGRMNEEIRLDLGRRKFGYSAMMENWEGDYNIAQLIRNSNGLGCFCVYYMKGGKKYDKRGCVGTNHYESIVHLNSIEKFKEIRGSFSKIVAVDCNVEKWDNKKGYYELGEYDGYCEGMLFVFGSESLGISEDILSLCDEMVYIRMYGSVRSLNAGCASGIVMNAAAGWFSRNGKQKE